MPQNRVGKSSRDTRRSAIRSHEGNPSPNLDKSPRDTRKPAISSHEGHTSPNLKKSSSLPTERVMINQVTDK